MADVPGFDELIRRVRAGDQDAATELVKRYEPAIRRAGRFRLADARLGTLLDSMDICQSVLASFFLRAASGQYELETPEQLLSLLTAMSRNRGDRGAPAGRRGRACRPVADPSDPVLDPLRRRRDFEAMILDLSFPADPFRR